MENNAKITSAQLKDVLFLKGTYEKHVEGGMEEIKFNRSVPIHDDLKVAFSKLDSHLMTLCCQPGPNEIKVNKNDIEMTVAIRCTGFALKDGGAILSGFRLLPNCRDIELRSPHTRFLEYDEWDFEYNGEVLMEVITEVCGEVHAYLFEDKHAPYMQQGDLFEGGGNENGSGSGVTISVDGRPAVGLDAFKKATDAAVKRRKKKSTETVSEEETPDTDTEF